MTDRGPIRLPPFPSDSLSLSDDRLALKLWDWFIKAQAIAYSALGGSYQNTDPTFLREVTATILRSDTDSAEAAALEKALKRIAKGDLEGGGRIFRKWYQQYEIVFPALMNEVMTGTRRQRTIAKKDRPTELQNIILSIVRNRPHINVSQLIHELRNLIHDGVIESVSETSIEFINKKGEIKETPVSGLKDRLSRARKKLGISLTG